jgi:hypothetical protein
MDVIFDFCSTLNRQRKKMQLDDRFKFILIILVMINIQMLFVFGAGTYARSMNTPEPTFKDIHYGPYKRQVMDLWLPQSSDATPVVVFIHGGGFMGGDKSQVQPILVTTMLKAGIAVVAINYRLTNLGPYPLPMKDGARAIQFLRYRAEKWNLDRSRFATTGASAGGIMSMWLAFHDDMANPNSENPLQRQSTRLTCSAPVAMLPSLERKVLFDWFGTTDLIEHPCIRPFFDINSLDELECPHVQKRVKDASPLTHLSPDDPPVYLLYGKPNTPVDENTHPNIWVHHPMAGIKFKAIMDKKGMECYVKYKGGPEVTPYSNHLEFLIAKLKSDTP